MSGSSRRVEFAEFLEDLKRRAGLSYAAVARKAYLSKSTVHRYCTGLAVPPEFGPVERIAKACGASKEEAAKLYTQWIRASAASEGNDVDESPCIIALTETPGRLSRDELIRSRTVHPVAAFAVVALLAVALVASGTLTMKLPASAGQQASGPDWVRPPIPVASSFFGVTMNSSSGTMPAFQVGAVRLWDSRTRWANLQPARGTFDWTTLDRLVDGANRAGLPVLFVLGGTPEWAAPTGRRSGYDDGSRTAPPDDLADWDAFITALVTRYQGRIEGYELWVMGNDDRLYSGSQETLVELTRRANAIIERVDARATTVCPSMGQLWKPDAREVLQRFAQLGGYQHCDVAGIKLHQRSASDPPETMLEIVNVVDRTLHEAGVHPVLWNTGTTYEIPLQGSLDQARAANHAIRFYLVGLYARNVSLERMYFYNWGGTKIPIVLQAEGGAPTPAALAVAQLQQWLRNAQIRSCGRGRGLGLPDNVWQCDFTVDGGHDAVIRWTDQGTATVTGPRAAQVHQLDGTVSSVGAHEPVRVSEQPVLLRY